MKKDVHYSVVFAPSPALATTRLIQAYAVGHSKYRFGFDVDQAFLHAESTPQEQIAIRFADGIREYNENGEELYGLLLKNIYGSPTASRNWTRHRDNFMLNVMNKQLNWQVEQMKYDPCLFKITTDQGRNMLIVVHTDDVDGVCDDPRDAEIFQDAFDKEFGVSRATRGCDVSGS